MDSNYDLEKIFNPHKLLILKSRTRRQKHQKQVSGTKSVPKLFRPAPASDLIRKKTARHR